jgi:hypothetical protein
MRIAWLGPIGRRRSIALAAAAALGPACGLFAADPVGPARGEAPTCEATATRAR